MEAKYGVAVKAGIIGGILAAILFIIVIVIGIVITNVTWFTLGELLAWLLLAAIMIITGMLAIGMAGTQAGDVDDAVRASGFAGAIAGFVGWLVFTIAISISQFFVQYDFLADLGRFNVLATRSTLSLICGGMSCCMLPFIIMASILLAVVGGWVYWLLVAKK